MKADLIIKNIGQLVTMAGHGKPWTRKEIKNFVKIKNGCIVVIKDKIAAVGSEDILKDFEIVEDTKVFDANGKCVTPGLIDPHVHLIFYGWRENELALKLKGLSYIEILESGGGILSTVKNTRNATERQLFEHTKKLLDQMVTHGTTTSEAKSGYGLSLEDELKSLRVIRDLNKSHVIDLVPTFLGAHAVPEEYIGKREQYVELIIDEMIPSVAQNNLAEFCDVFCEDGVFTVEDARKILNTGKRYGLKPKIHADELAPYGGAELAAEAGATSAEHLLCVSDEGINAMAKRGVIADLLPGTPFYLMLDKYAPFFTNDSCSGSNSPFCSKPSIVIISLPWICEAKTKQELTAFLSIITVQVPHSPSPQPSFVPVKSNSSLKISNNLNLGSTSIE
jgi:imidazolonepropionase